MSRFNILRNADIRNSSSCRFDTNEGYSVVWDEDNNFKDYVEFDEITTRLVSDQSYFFVATSGTCYVSPSTDQPTFDAGPYDTIKVNYRVEVGFNQVAPTTGKIQFQTVGDPLYDEEKVVEFPINPDNAYNEYTINMSQHQLWTGDILRLRLYPFIDGGPGNIVHLRSIGVYSSSKFTCGTKFSNPLCNKFSQYSHPCPWTGAGGSCESQLISDGLSIVEGVNDEIIVNINDYGEQRVTLRPVRSALLTDIARDLEDKLSNIAIGGYAGSKVEVALNKIKIIADDTREDTSSVVVSDTPAARTLGFFDANGNSVSDNNLGEQAADRYEPAGTVQLSKSEIAHFYVPDQNTNESAIIIDPRSYAVQAGRHNFSLVTQERYVDFPAATGIDFNNPVTQTGNVYFFGFSGNATVNTEILFFRPKANGSLTLIHSIPLGATGVLTNKVFDKDIAVNVHKGDFVGIYDARIYTGDDAQHPNVSYFRYEGLLSVGDVIDVPAIYGKGDEGLQLYVRGKSKQTKVVLDIDFYQPELIEEIEVIAQEEARVEIINLSQALSGGVNGGPHISTETGLDKYGAQAPGLTDLGAATDGIKVRAPNALSLHPVWLDSGFSPADKYDQTEFSITLDFAKAVPVFFNIYRLAMYFRDPDNIKFFRIDYPLTTDEEDLNRYWGSVTNEFNNVRLDDVLLKPKTHPLYSHPVQVNILNHTHSYKFLEYSKIDLEFNPVRARSLKYEVKNYFFNDDVTSDDKSDFVLANSPHILEMEVFAKSVPKASIADNFFFESANESDTFVPHTVTRDVGTTSAKYLVGYPVRKLRATITPQGRLEVSSFAVTLSQSSVDIDTNAGEQTVSLQISKEDFTSAEVATVTNYGDGTFNYYIDIAPQRNSIERCLLWNKMGTEDELTKSQIGPSPALVKRDSFLPREMNFALSVPAYVLDPFWMQNRNVKTYISYDEGITWEYRGNILGDYAYETTLDSKTPLYDSGLQRVYILIDLGKTYRPVTVEMLRPSGGAYSAFSTTIQYSNKDTGNPEEMDVNGDFSVIVGDCRWLRLSAAPHNPASFSSVPTISFVRLTMDPTAPHAIGDAPWIAEPRLTNYIFGSNNGGTGTCGEGWHCAQETAVPDPPHFYAIDLEEHYDPYNIILGPNTSDALSLTEDIDTLLPGGAGSAYPSTTSRVNSNIAYGHTKTSDPSKVIWGDWGEEPPPYTRWILLRRFGWIWDEVAVFVNGNDPTKKPLFASTRWWTSKLGTVVKDYSNTVDGTHSISIDYAAGQGPEVEEIEVQQSFGIDENLAKKDQLKVMFYVSDVSQFDLTQGHIALGRNTTEDNDGSTPLVGTEPDRISYYQWNLADMPGLIGTGWNEIYLPFTDNFRVGEPYFTKDDELSLGPNQTHARSRIRWFRVNFAGRTNNVKFSVKVAGLEIVRGDFIPAKFGNGYYLANTDYAKFPINNFNTLQGTVEFYLRPDWTKTPDCNSCDDARDHTIFRLFNSDDFMVALFMTGKGMLPYATNGSDKYILTDNNSPQRILNDVNTHIAVTWDFLGERSDKGLAFYVNGVLSSAIAAVNMKDSVWSPNPNVVFMLGGEGWDGLISASTGSVDGVVDNLRVYNYAKSDFSHSLQNESLAHTRPSDELIEISTDGVNFYGSDTRGFSLPLLVRNVAPGEGFKVYIRNKEQDGVIALEGQERTSFLQIIKSRSG